MNSSLRRLALATTLALGSFGASALELPSGACNGQNCLQFSDFQVYSLTLLNGGSAPNGNDPWYVSSTPGTIKDFIVIGVNANGQASTNVSGVDNAYNTPSANNGGASTFSTLSSDPANGPGTGDGNSWQASLSVLKDQFAGSKFVGFFAFNETGGTGGARDLLNGGPDLLAWAKLTLVDLQNTASNKSYYLQPTGSTLNNNPLASALPPSTASDGQTGPWAYVHGSICMSGTTFTGFPNANGVCAIGSPKAQTNTGQNNASFAIYNEDLDNEIHKANTNYDLLQIDWELAYINGGGETAWIQPFGRYEEQVPEPGSLALIGIALAGLGFARKRKAG